VSGTEALFAGAKEFAVVALESAETEAPPPFGGDTDAEELHVFLPRRATTAGDMAFGG
jgi:hypothetical protein